MQAGGRKWGLGGEYGKQRFLQSWASVFSMCLPPDIDRQMTRYSREAIFSPAQPNEEIGTVRGLRRLHGPAAVSFLSDPLEQVNEPTVQLRMKACPLLRSSPSQFGSDLPSEAITKETSGCRVGSAELSWVEVQPEV